MAALAVLALGVGTRTARASDIIKLGLNQSAPTVTLDLKPGQDADVEEANWRRGYYGGYRGYYGGYGGYYGGYRGYYGGGYYSGYGGGYGGGYYRPSYYYGYRPSYYYGYSSYYPSYYSYPSYYYQPYYYPSYSYYSPYYYPISLKVTTSPSVCVPGGSYQPYPQMDPLPNQTIQPNQQSQPLPSGPSAKPNLPNDGTYPYDGGPSNPVPMPKVEPTPNNPQSAPMKGFAPGEGRLISLPMAASAPTPKYTYPAYGDQKKVTGTEDRGLTIKK